MKAKALFLGHPIHQMLIVFPLGLLGTAVIFDVIYLVTELSTMAIVSYWMLTAGLVGAMFAIPFGMMDYSKIPPDTRAKRIGLMHGVGNAVVSVLFIVSWYLREADTLPTATAMAWSFAGVALALVTAWWGGELVSRLGIGVYSDASPNAGSSLDVPRD
ncbi:DUF2231 domain-containing protein [Limnobacter parvus]|uniref:DUF2231 domain-containing protein n=1 Tax=Limnobacter parvus TaxID=2939690 RepID=A0ABT1XMD9_9BURK|nr:DUF2231 domain-containing protein [Limnobacter parvus]MCR2747437.1 DUF2231 domain-containing protein [Limnobacter parvus]